MARITNRADPYETSFESLAAFLAAIRARGIPVAGEIALRRAQVWL
jgi:hypothetical protein